MPVVRVGQEILVNTATTNSQDGPQITALSNGGYVVTWNDNSQGAGGAGGDTSDYAIKAQVFAAGGTPVGAEIRVNTATDSGQILPRIAALANGGFVVTWEDGSEGVGGAGGDSDSYAVKAQVFAAGGTPVGSEIRVNTATTGAQNTPQINALSDGGFVVTWRDFSQGVGGAGGDTSGDAVKAQVFAADGTAVGTEILVNTATFSGQYAHQSTALANGGFVVTWVDLSQGVGGAGGDSSDWAVKAQVFAAGGTPVGSEILVNTATPRLQEDPQITALANGGFVVTWNDDSRGVGGAGGDTSIWAVKAQVFAAGGTPVGAEILVNTATADQQLVFDIAALSTGGFVVTWYDFSLGVGGAGGDTDDYAVKAQVFAAGGTPVGAEILVNTATAGVQYNPQITALADGGFVVTWNDNSHGVGGAGGDTSGAAVKAQVFAADGTPDGAEILVNTATISDQLVPKIAALANGGFVVTWYDDSQGVGGTGGDTSGNAVKAQVFGLDGAPVHLIGTPNDDAFTAPAGQARIDGLGSIDTVTFGFKLTDATVTYSGNQVIIDSASSHTVLTGFERFVFTDGTVNNDDNNWLVDDLFYYSRNHDIWNAGADADAHFASLGWKEDRDPSAFFDISLYLALYPDVKAAGVNPLTHFDQFGWKEGRVPSAAFDTAAYLAANPDVAAAGAEPLRHFLVHGAGEGRQPFMATELVASNGFDAIFYLQSNADVAAAGIDPFAHFQQSGWKEGRNPNALFDVNGYLATYGDVKAAGINPLDHYHVLGWKEDRDPSTAFDSSSYRSAYPDVAAANVDPLAHFLDFGRHEGRQAVNDGMWG